MTGTMAIIISLIVVIIGILGIGGGKMWGEKKVNSKVTALDKKFMNIHETCHTACKEARVAAEEELAKAVKSLEDVLTKQLQPRLIMGNFIMDALAEKVGVPKAQLEQIKQNVINGSLKDF